jgi:K+-transporting ATPase ATPase A chain
MKFNDITEIIVFLGLLIFIVPTLGSYMAKVFSGDKMFLSSIENLIYKFIGINPKDEMNWKNYAKHFLLFNFAGLVVLTLILMFQNYLPLNPQGLPGVPFHLAFNTAVSFVTNTNWQSYSGENTLSYFSQMFGLTSQNFISPACGFVVLLVLIRGLKVRQYEVLGNFYVDMTRSILYILLPLSIIFAIFLVSQGVVQSFSPYALIDVLGGKSQVIPLGPAASQIAIKQLGSNGGGFFGVNSAHPFENPTPLSNFFEAFAIILIPASLVYTFGKILMQKKHSRILFMVMILFMVAGIILGILSEYSYNPVLGTKINLEGKETRFGITSSLLWSIVTTCVSSGSVNSMMSSLNPLTAGIAMLNMMTGEIFFGGVGAGLYGMLIYVFITVFIAGLMVGRTPEYLGKKIDAYDIKMSIIAIIAPSAVILIFTALSLVIPAGTNSIMNSGPHGFSEVLYAFTSAAANNGSAFAGLNANTPYYNIMLALGMIIGRYLIIIPVLAIAGNMAKKNISPVSSGSFRTDNTIFAILLIGVIIIISALTFLPSLALGPIVEHIQMLKGVAY